MALKAADSAQAAIGRLMDHSIKISYSGVRRSSFTNNLFASFCDNRHLTINVEARTTPNSALGSRPLDGQTSLLVGHRSSAERR